MDKQLCSQCGSQLQTIGGLEICPRCNDTQGEYYNFFSRNASDFGAASDRIMIECHGASLYRPGTDEVIAGVKFADPDNPSGGFEIIGQSLYGPRHVKRRWVKKDDAHLIRRCQSCQDYTVRMRRKEGPDLFIPSRHKPQRQSARHGQSAGYKPL